MIDISTAVSFIDIFNQIIAIDWLFWGWVIVTVLFFLDLVIPDPIPYIDEIFLGVMFFVLLGALILRMIARGVISIFSTATHPLVLAFVGTLFILFLYAMISGKYKRKKK